MSNKSVYHTYHVIRKQHTKHFFLYLNYQTAFHCLISDFSNAEAVFKSLRDGVPALLWRRLLSPF